LSNAYCPFGCCRDVPINFRFLSTFKPKVVRVLGLRKGEEDKLKKKLEDLGLMTDEEGEKCELPFTLQCNPQDDPWAHHKRLPKPTLIASPPENVESGALTDYLDGSG
jgi:hypothetical protein